MFFRYDSRVRKPSGSPGAGGTPRGPAENPRGGFSATSALLTGGRRQFHGPQTCEGANAGTASVRLPVRYAGWVNTLELNLA